MRYLILILLLALPAAAQTRISGARILEKASNHATLTSAGTDSYTATLGSGTSALKSYSEGNVYSFIADVANSGSATLDINGIGAVTIIRRDGSGLQNGDLSAGEVVTVRFDATNRFQLQGPSGSQTVPPHAATHQDGGADEVATVTPAAGAIPKADAGGQLAAGYIPQIPTSRTDFPPVAGSTQQALEALHNIYWSSGVTTGGVITDAGGTVDVSGGSGTIRTADTTYAPIRSFDFPGSTGFVIPLNEVRYFRVEYNGGSPQVAMITIPSWNSNDNFPLGVVANDANEIKIGPWPWYAGDGNSRLNNWAADVFGFSRSRRSIGGLNISPNGLYVQMDAGTLWAGINRVDVAALDTSGADRIDRYYRDGAGGHVKENDEQEWVLDLYDDNSGGPLPSMSNNNYGTRWFGLLLNGEVFMVYGASNVQTLEEARSETPPQYPSTLATMGRYTSRWVIQEGNSVPPLVESIFEPFSSGTVQFHNELAGRDAVGAHPVAAITGASSYSEGTTAPPATCTVGEKYLRTDTDQAYQCTSTNTWTETTGGGGGGDVVGPASATDRAIAIFDGTTGKLIQNTATAIDANGFLTEGIGVVTGHINSLGNPGDEGASRQDIYGGNGDNNTEPGSLRIFGSDPTTPIETSIAPCGSSGRLCATPVTPTSDSGDHLAALSDITGSKTFDLDDPATAQSGKYQFDQPYKANLVEIYCNVDVGSATVNIAERTRADPNTGTTGKLTADLVCVPTGAAGAAFTDASVADGSQMALLVTAVSGTPTIVRVAVRYSRVP